MTHDQRHRLGCAILTVGAAGLAAASLAIVSQAADPSTRVGRHLIAGALANFALAVLMGTLAAVPLRRSHRWAFWAYLVPLLVYGVPVLLMDSTHVPRERLVATLAPQVAGLFVSACGLALVAPGVFGRNDGGGRPPSGA